MRVNGILCGGSSDRIGGNNSALVNRVTVFGLERIILESRRFQCAFGFRLNLICKVGKRNILGILKLFFTRNLAGNLGKVNRALINLLFIGGNDEGVFVARALDLIGFLLSAEENILFGINELVVQIILDNARNSDSVGKSICNRSS